MLSSLSTTNSHLEFGANPNINTSGIFTGYLEKKNVSDGKYLSYYFVMSDGKLMNYEKGPVSFTNAVYSNVSDDAGIGLKGTFSLVGAFITLYNKILMTLILAENKKLDISLKASNEIDGKNWYKAIHEEIERLNVAALYSNSRIPEVVEWYYQKQDALSSNISTIENEHSAWFYYLKAGRKNKYSSSNVYIKTTDSKNGILFRFDSDRSRKLDAIESSYNGREVLLSDILYAELNINIEIDSFFISANSGQDASNDSNMNRYCAVKSKEPVFKLVTNEGDIVLRMKDNSLKWVRCLHVMSLFLSIPQPSSRSVSNSALGCIGNTNGGYSPPRFKSISSVVDANASGYVSIDNKIPTSIGKSTLSRLNSITAFGIAGDVIMYINSMKVCKRHLTILPSLADAFSAALHLILEVKCNKEAAAELGERMEDVIRCLGDPKAGILYTPDINDRFLDSYLLSLSHKVKEIKDFFDSITHPNWLRVLLHPAMDICARFQKYDDSLIGITNILLAKIELSNLLFTKKKYECVIDVKKSVDALGGVDAIYADAAKSRALSRLIQADSSDVLTELLALQADHKLRDVSLDDGRRSGSIITGFVYGNAGVNKNDNQSLCSRITTCFTSCFARRSVSGSQSLFRKSRHLQLDLEEPLF